MSESLHPGGVQPIDIMEGLASEMSGQYVLTHRRFALTDTDTDFVVTEPETGNRNRYLIVMHDDGGVYDALQTAGIPQLSRKSASPEVTIYDLPIQVKQLAQEKLFSGHTSSDTYVSDQEIFSQLGSLWARIYDATKRVPVSQPLSHTALIDFEADSARLLPIPPYADWEEEPSREVAAQKFAARLGDQLQAIEPHQLHRGLLEIVRTAWIKPS